MKRTDEQLRYIIKSAKELTHDIHVKARATHSLTLIECEQLHTLEVAKRNAQINLNQSKMRKWGKV